MIERDETAMDVSVAEMVNGCTSRNRFYRHRRSADVGRIRP